MRRITGPIIAGLLEAAPDATVCVDSGGQIVLVNAQAERLFGYPREELAGQPVEILVPDASKARHAVLRTKYAANPAPRLMGARVNLSCRRRDGTIFPADIALAALHTDQGILISAAIRDITQQQQAALAQARLASIIESAHDAIFSLDLDGLITSWNRGAERLYGYTATEIIGRHCDLLLPAGQRFDVHKTLASLARGEGIEEHKAEPVRKDGTAIQVMVTLASIADKTGTVTGLSAVVRDISAQQRAGARFRGLLEAGPDAMVCVDSGGQIVLVNAQAERLFGYPREELAGQPVEILVPDASKARHPALRAGYAADPTPRPMGAGLNLSGRRRDGTAFPAEIVLSALDTDQGILVSAAIRDVTQQRQARDDLRRTNENLRQLGYSLAHDLRTPLRSLAGFSTALMEDYADILGEDGRGYAQRIEAASEHIGHILDDLMQLSNVSRTEINLQPVNLGAEAATIATDLQRQDPARNVCFTIQPQAWSLADRALIREALRNLLDNAWKFTTGRDHASIEFGMTPAANARVCCYVRDNGAGFDPAYAGKLFTPFERLHTTREFPGTGIGLATVRQIVDRHGGQTWAEGTVGEGATFFFTLQAAEPAAQPDEYRRRHPPADHRRQAGLPRPVGRPEHGLHGRGTGTVHGRPGKVGPGKVGPDVGGGQFDPVPALPLGNVQRGVGEPVEPLQRARVVGEASDTDGDRDRHVGSRHGDLGYRRPDALGDLEGRGDIGVGQQDRELLPAVAPGEVPGPQHAAQRGADARQDLVPRGMPVLVVDLLEVVEVEQEQRERRPRHRGLRERPLQRVRDRPLVGQPGQAVGRGADLRDGQVAEVRQDGRKPAIKHLHCSS